MDDFKNFIFIFTVALIKAIVPDTDMINYETRLEGIFTIFTYILVLTQQASYLLR